MAGLQPGQCLVTLDGGAWRWDGLVVSSNAENAAAIRLQQKNRLAELEIEIASAQTQLDAARTAGTPRKTHVLSRLTASTPRARPSASRKKP